MKIRLPVRKPGPPLKRPPQLKLKASVARSRRAPIVEEEDFLEEPEPNMRLSHAFVVVLVLHVIAVAGVFAFNSIKTKQAEIFSAVNASPAKPADAPAPGPVAEGSADRSAAPAENAAASNGASLAPSPAADAPAAPTAPAPTTTARSGAKTHELQPGETLTKVAATYGVTIADLQKANNITDPKKMRAGMVLTIPEGGTPPAAGAAQPATARAQAQYQPLAVAPPAKPAVETPAKPAAATAKDSGKTYVVVKGDNPVKIAKHLKVAYAELLALNGITDPRKLQIGQKLKIPAAK